MAWVSADQVRGRVARKLSRDPALTQPDPRALESKWDGIIPDAIQRAVTDLSNYLRGKGFTAAQLAAWDDAQVYSSDQAFYYAMIEGGSPEDRSDAGDLKRFDRVTYLMKLDDPLTLSIGGVLVVPGAADDISTMAAGTIAPAADGVPYGDLFGLARRRNAGLNQYGDELSGWDG